RPSARASGTRLHASCHDASDDLCQPHLSRRSHPTATRRLYPPRPPCYACGWDVPPAGHGDDRHRALQRMRAVRRRLPSSRPGHDGARGEPDGLPLSAAPRRMHRLRAVLPHLPRLLLRGLPRRGRSERGRPRGPMTARRVLMEGSHAIAEAAIQAGCRFYAGYPITPSTEILEYMSFRQPQVGGVCVNAESEIEAINMVWGAAGCGVRAMIASTGQG